MPADSEDRKSGVSEWHTNFCSSNKLFGVVFSSYQPHLTAPHDYSVSQLHCSAQIHSMAEIIVSVLEYLFAQKSIQMKKKIHLYLLSYLLVWIQNWIDFMHWQSYVSWIFKFISLCIQLSSSLKYWVLAEFFNLSTVVISENMNYRQTSTHFWV